MTPAAGAPADKRRASGGSTAPPAMPTGDNVPADGAADGGSTASAAMPTGASVPADRGASGGQTAPAEALTALAPLNLGRLAAPLPVVLAPMAGVTNLPFRLLCRSFGTGLFVTEMVTGRALAAGHPATLALLRHDPAERPRSVQLLGADPATVAAAARLIRQGDLADHIDLNFGCPVPKVTRQGAGAALPWRREVFRRVVAEAVAAADPLPVTVKLRLGLDADRLTFLDAGLAAEAAGAAAITLHARTAAQYYSGRADWSRIAELKRAVRSVPVLGNGDVFTADDAAAMVSQTGCDGVV
ncbi:MAG: tRNA-dihydrouridine synthase, partial [Bifidobacteriaceae bacterium]|nr:tRNA-dihydrouridine synthase [Bifidobacteriaceae bacterium]